MKNLIGRKFSRLIVMHDLGVDVHMASIWHCRCDCGRDVVVTGSNLKSGNTTSCGCYRNEIATRRLRPRVVHGMHRGPEYVAYMNAKHRCKAASGRTWEDYGARGIQFKFASFQEWLKELGARPGRGFSVDRINNNGHYEPGNVRWATRKQQEANKGMRRRQRAPVPYEVRLKTAESMRRARQALTPWRKDYRAAAS